MGDNYNSKDFRIKTELEKLDDILSQYKYRIDCIHNKEIYKCYKRFINVIRYL